MPRKVKFEVTKELRLKGILGFVKRRVKIGRASCRERV